MEYSVKSSIFNQKTLKNVIYNYIHYQGHTQNSLLLILYDLFLEL